MNMKKSQFCLIALVSCLSFSSPATTFNVTSVSGLQSAINGAVAGDTIILANGSYTLSGDISVTRTGASGSPITIMAASIGGVTFNGTGGFHLKSPATYIVIQGFKFRSSGTLTMDVGTSHCEITRNDFQHPSTYTGDCIWLQGNDQEVDYNVFQNKTSGGRYITLDLSGRSHSGTQRSLIDHNYFFNKSQPSSGASECITTWGEFTTAEYNRFEQINSDPEIISVKASDGIYRYNTFTNCGGGLVLRFARRCTVNGNFFFNCNPGMRVYGSDQNIYNNYIESCTTGIMVGDGHSDGTYIQPDHMVIVYNTLVNNGKGIGPNGSDLTPTNMTFANNIILQSTGTFFDWSAGWLGSRVINGNIMWGGASRGDMPTSGYSSVDPLLAPDADSVDHIQSGSPAINAGVGSYSFVTDDLDGQSRGTPDVGADEFSSGAVTKHVMAVSDVGPNADLNTGDGIDTTAIYQIQNEASSLVLNQQGSLTNGSAITQWSASSTSDNLRWKFIATDSGYYQINSVKSGKDVAVQSASTSTGAGIIQWSFGSAQNDQWKPTLNADGSYTLVNRHSGLVLDDPGSSTSTSKQMDQWTANGGANQKWNLIKQ